MYLLRVISVISAFLPVQSPCFFDVRIRIPPYNGGGGEHLLMQFCVLRLYIYLCITFTAPPNSIVCCESCVINKSLSCDLLIMIGRVFPNLSNSCVTTGSR